MGTICVVTVCVMTVLWGDESGLLYAVPNDEIDFCLAEIEIVFVSSFCNIVLKTQVCAWFHPQVYAFARRATSCGFHLIPVPCDPFALPYTENSDPLRGPTFVPLNMQALNAEFLQGKPALTPTLRTPIPSEDQSEI